MATKILLKKSSTSGAVPLTGDLDQAELAINLADRKIYTKNNSGAIVKINGAYVDSVAPSNPAEGDIWYDTTNNYLKAYNGSAWVNAGYTTLGEFGITASAAELNILDGATVTTAELNVLDGITATTTELNYVDGVTSNIQTQLDGKASTTHNHTLDSLSNTTITSNTSGEILKWNGSAWVNNTLAEAGIAAASHTHVAADITNLESTVEGYFSVTDNGGDGSLSYVNGVFTYTGPSASEVRAHFSGGTGVTITNGSIAIGQDVGTTSNVTFNDITTTGTIYGPATMTLDPSGHGDDTGTVVIAGNLTVNGTTTSVNSNEVNIGDSIILLNADETAAPSQNGGIEIERGTSANVSFVWNEADDAWDLNNETLQNVVIDGGSY